MARNTPSAPGETKIPKGAAFFGKECMLNAHVTYIIIIVDAVLLGKAAALLGLLGCFDVLIGHEMVHDKRNFGLVKHIGKAEFFKLIDGNG